MVDVLSMPKTRKFRPPVKTFGGKGYLCRQINPILESVPHQTYVEPFGGGFACGLNKEPVDKEVYNDLDPCKAALFKVLRDQCNDLVYALRAIDYSEANFLRFKSQNDEHRKLEPGIDGYPYLAAAVSYFVTSRMSRGGMGKNFAWSKRLRGGQPGDLNAWLTILDHLPLVSARVQGLMTYCAPASEIIDDFRDDETVLIYNDAPYPHSTRRATNVYDFEMTDPQHVEYLELLRDAKCKAAISTYFNQMYEKILINWNRHEFDIANHSGQSKSKERRIEVLYTNF